MKRGKSNKAQMQISFGMIFSILLIVIFVVFAFFGIKKFMEVQNNILVNKFIDDLDNDVAKMWESSRGSQEVKYILPKKIQEVCFKEDNKENVYFISKESFDGGRIGYVNYETTLDGEEETCFNVENKKVSFVIDKTYGENSVTISEEGRDTTMTYGSFSKGNFYVGEAQNHGTYEEILNNPRFKVLFNLDFEDNTYLGKYKTLGDFRADWKTSWGNRGEELEIVEDPVDSNNKVALMTFPFWDPVNFTWICWGDGCGDSESRRIYFPYDEEPTFARHRELLDGVGPASGGGTWYIPLGGDYEEAYLSYNIKYEPDWAAPAGGKLPGFTRTPSVCDACKPTDCMDEQGNKYNVKWNEQTKKWDSNPPQDGIADDFTAKHMFHGNDHISYYIYDADKVNVCGDSYGVPNSMIYDGNWHNIVLRVKMNTPDVANGIVETWIDGENQGAVTNILFRTGYAKFGINSISFSNFFGGSGSPCSDVENSFASSCARGEWWPHLVDSWVPICAVDPSDPCSDILRYSDGSPQTYWNNRQTEYIHFDDIIAYTYA